MKKKTRRTPRLTRTERALIDAAAAARERAYAPYSGFKVGAALRARDGKFFTGCNVENASFGATVCAERNALAQAVVCGHREFDLLAIVTDTSPPSPPCGVCRQVLVEFCNDLAILLFNPRGQPIRTSLKKLLPKPFSGDSL